MSATSTLRVRRTWAFEPAMRAVTLRVTGRISPIRPASGPALMVRVTGNSFPFASWLGTRVYSSKITLGRLGAKFPRPVMSVLEGASRTEYNCPRSADIFSRPLSAAYMAILFCWSLPPILVSVMVWYTRVTASAEIRISRSSAETNANPCCLCLCRNIACLISLVPIMKAQVSGTDRGCQRDSLKVAIGSAFLAGTDGNGDIDFLDQVRRPISGAVVGFQGRSRITAAIVNKVITDSEVFNVLDHGNRCLQVYLPHQAKGVITCPENSIWSRLLLNEVSNQQQPVREDVIRESVIHLEGRNVAIGG